MALRYSVPIVLGLVLIQPMSILVWWLLVERKK